MVSRNTNNLHDSSQQQQQQQHRSSMVPESEGAIMHGRCVHHWRKSLNQLITRNSQGDLHMPKIKELFEVKSSWAAWAAMRCTELRSSHQFAITFGKWEHEIVDSLFQFKANKIKWFSLVLFSVDLTEKKRNLKNFSNHMQVEVIYDSLRKGFQHKFRWKQTNSNSLSSSKTSWITLTWRPNSHGGNAFNSVQQF